MSDELKPCPFCGANDAVETDMEGMRRTVYFVSCNKCGAAGPSRVYPDHSQPLTEADLWNLRATPSPDQSDRERAGAYYHYLRSSIPHAEGPKILAIIDATLGAIDWDRAEIRLASLLAEVRAEERERCAKVCEGMSQAFTPCADAIRGLK